jgi:hypothetical protein
MNYQGLRDWLAQIAQRGELTTLENVDWNLEMGAIVDVLYREHPPYPPALLFDKIKDHRPGYRALFGHFASPERIALTLGVSEPFDHVLQFTRMYHEKIKHCVPLPRTEVKTGPVHENVQEGDRVNLLDFPAPLLHEKDGGRYLGTGHLVITKDPDSDWVNVGTYRIMSQDRNSAGIYIGPGKHGYMHKQKYFEKNQPMPVNVVLGSDPLVWFAASCPVAAGVSEFDFAGGLRGEPIEVIRSDLTGLPYPADAEIVLEGEIRPGELIKRRRPFRGMARLLRQSEEYGTVHPREKNSSSQRSDPFLRQSGAPAAHADLAARDHALGACVGGIGKSRSAGDSRRLVARAGSATVHGRRHQAALSRPRQTSGHDRVAVFFRRLSKSLHDRCRRRYRSDAHRRRRLGTVDALRPGRQHRHPAALLVERA